MATLAAKANDYQCLVVIIIISKEKQLLQELNEPFHCNPVLFVD